MKLFQKKHIHKLAGETVYEDYCIGCGETVSLIAEEELFELEQQLNIPMKDRFYNLAQG